LPSPHARGKREAFNQPDESGFNADESRFTDDESRFNADESRFTDDESRFHASESRFNDEGQECTIRYQRAVTGVYAKGNGGSR
jgi:hypothetical protein